MERQALLAVWIQLQIFYRASYFSSGTFFWIDDPSDRFISKSEDKSRCLPNCCVLCIIWLWIQLKTNVFRLWKSVVSSETQISEMCLTGHTIYWLHSLHIFHSDKIFEICNFHYANLVHEWKATCKIYMEVYYTHI